MTRHVPPLPLHAPSKRPIPTAPERITPSTREPPTAPPPIRPLPVPRLQHILLHDLRDTGRLLALYEQAVQAQWP